MTIDKVTVVGGGIGGLVLALALQRRGVEVEVHEQADVLDEIGAGIALWSNGTRLLRRLGLGPALEELASEPTDLIFRNGVDGARISARNLTGDGWYEKEFGSNYVGIHRKNLQRILVSALAPGTIRLGRRLTAIVGDGPVKSMQWSDGSTSEATVIVAADGIRSVVRQWMTGRDDTMFSRTSGFRGVVPIGAVPSLPDPTAVQFWVGDGKHLLHFPIGPDYELLTFLAVVEGPEKWPHPTYWRVPCTQEEALREFADWHPAVSEMIAAVEHDERWGLFGIGPLERWSVGNVVLTGDAAHGMLPHHGQGGTQSIEDAVALADALTRESDDSLEYRLRRYEELRKPRAQHVQKTSWVTNRWLHTGDGPQAAERDALFDGVADHLRWIHEYDVQDAAIDAARSGGRP